MKALVLEPCDLVRGKVEKLVVEHRHLLLGLLLGLRTGFQAGPCKVKGLGFQWGITGTNAVTVLCRVSGLGHKES